MKVPLLDLKAQFKIIEQELKKAVNETLESTQYILGPRVEELEKKIADYVGARYAIGVSSGTDALLLCLMGLNAGPGDLVITTPYSFFATAGVIARVHANPVFVDIDPRTYNMNPDKLFSWLKKNSKRRSRVKAIMPVHLYGQCADMDAICEIAGEYQIPVIEDAAQAIGSQYPSKTGVKKAGTMGLAGCFSFFPSKNLGGIGDGGIVTTNDEGFADKIRKLRTHGAERVYYHSLVGGNFRLDAIQAAALVVKLPYLDQWHEMRRKNAAYYDENFKHSKIRIPHSALHIPFIAYKREYHIYNQYVISVSEKRDELREFLQTGEIGCAVYYPVPFHEQECFKYLGYKTGDFPKSEYASKHTLALPIYPELTSEMQDFVIGKIKEFYSK
jgi:dTDP-4-amino-4,6-dideoxygalactose transaminase